MRKKNNYNCNEKLIPYRENSYRKVFLCYNAHCQQCTSVGNKSNCQQIFTQDAARIIIIVSKHSSDTERFTTQASSVWYNAYCQQFSSVWNKLNCHQTFIHGATRMTTTVMKRRSFKIYICNICGFLVL